MIRAKVVSLTFSESLGDRSKLDLETYLEDHVALDPFYEAILWEGQDLIIMTKEEHEAEVSKGASLHKKLSEKEGEICKLIVVNNTEQARFRERIKKLVEENTSLKDDIKDLEEKMAQEAAEVDIHPDGTIVFRNKRVSELEKEVEKLRAENNDLKGRLLARYKVKFDAIGATIYPASKED